MLGRVRDFLGAANTGVRDFRRLVTTSLIWPLERLIRTRLVNFDKVPDRVGAAQATFLQTSAVFPTVAKRGVTTKVACNDNAWLAGRLGSVFTRSVLVHFKVAELVSTIVCAASRVFRGQTGGAVVRQDRFRNVISSRAKKV